jgi:hypothetical protein
MNFSRIWVSGLVVFEIALLLGCSQPRPRIETLPLPELSHLIADAETNRAALNDFRGEGLVIVRGPGVNSAMGISITHLYPGFLKLSLRGPMGIPVGFLTVAKGYYELDYMSSSGVARGVLDSLDLSLDFGFPICGGELMDIFSPLISLAAVPDTAALIRDADRQLHQISWIDDGIRHRIWLDPFEPAGRMEVVIAANSDTLWMKQTGALKRRSGVFLPLTWTVQLGNGSDSYTVKLKLSNLWVNRGVSAAEFDIEGLPESSEAHHDGWNHDLSGRTPAQ